MHARRTSVHSCDAHTSACQRLTMLPHSWLQGAGRQALGQSTWIVQSKFKQPLAGREPTVIHPCSCTHEALFLGLAPVRPQWLNPDAHGMAVTCALG
jgi:hypothetical protein